MVTVLNPKRDSKKDCRLAWSNWSIGYCRELARRIILGAGGGAEGGPNRVDGDSW